MWRALNPRQQKLKSYKKAITTLDLNKELVLSDDRLLIK